MGDIIPHIIWGTSMGGGRSQKESTVQELHVVSLGQWFWDKHRCGKQSPDEGDMLPTGQRNCKWMSEISSAGLI